MIQPLAPHPTDTPDLAPLLRQGDLEDALLNLLEDTFRATNSHVTYLHGDPYSLVVDKSMGGQVVATLYREPEDGASIEVAQVRLGYTVEQVQP